MKKLVIATATTLLLVNADLALADYSFVSKDGSAITALCIAATTTPSMTALGKTAASLGLVNENLATVSCNGMPLPEFQAKYGKPSMESAHYVLKKGDESRATELCAAAAISDLEYQKVKAAYFSNEPSLESEVFCNGMSLKSFARKYRTAGALALSQR